MRGWLFWAGVGFVIGGLVSYSMALAVPGPGFQADVSGYALGWMGAGAVLLAAGLVLKPSKAAG